MGKIGRNTLCLCGSGKKYKKCCILKNEGMNRLFQKLANGELPFTAQIISKDGKSSSMQVHSASIVNNGIEKKLFDDPIELSVNSVTGDTKASSATFTIPVQSNQNPEINIQGNASVTNGKGVYKINPFREKITSKSGIKAQINVKTTPEDHIDILFFTHSKEHPHISFFPDGNGRYFGQRGYDCELKSILNYDPANKLVSPSEIEITVKDIIEKLFIKLSFDNSTKTVTIVSTDFI